MAPDSGRGPGLAAGSGRQGSQGAKSRGGPLTSGFESMSNKVPEPIRLLQLGGALGITFWIVTIGRAFSDGSRNVLGVELIGATVLLAVLASLPTSRSWLYGAPQN